MSIPKIYIHEFLWTSMYPQGSSRKSTDGDEKTMSIFSQANGQRLKNIQVLNLMKECPQSRDYYGLMKKINENRKAENKTSKDDLVDDCVIGFIKSLYPKYRLGHVMDQEDSRKNNISSSSKNVLGAPQPHSNQCPKILLDQDILPKEAPHESCIIPTPNNNFDILLAIEKIYANLLIVEENHIRTATLKYGSELDYELKKMAENKIIQNLQDSYLFEEILTVNKGRILMCRILKVVDKSIGTKLFYFLLKRFSSPEWTEMFESNHIKNLYDHLKNYIFHCKESEFLAFLPKFDDKFVSDVVLTKIGSSSVMAVIFHGDRLCKNSVDGKFRDLWAQKSLAFKNIEKFVNPYEIFEVVEEEETKQIQSDEEWDVESID